MNELLAILDETINLFNVVDKGSTDSLLADDNNDSDYDYVFVYDQTDLHKNGDVTEDLTRELNDDTYVEWEHENGNGFKYEGATDSTDFEITITKVQNVKCDVWQNLMIPSLFFLCCSVYIFYCLL